MRLNHYSAEKLKQEILTTVGKHLDLEKYKVFFFGSRITGKGSDRSDIDVGIEGPEEIPGHIMIKIKEGLENLPLLYKIDVVDFKQVSEEFRAVARPQVEFLTVAAH